MSTDDIRNSVHNMQEKKTIYSDKLYINLIKATFKT